MNIDEMRGVEERKPGERTTRYGEGLNDEDNEADRNIHQAPDGIFFEVREVML